MASDTDALQFFHGFADIVESYIICDIRPADARRDDKADFSGFEFFVQLYCVENFFTWKVRRQPRGQPELSQKINNCGALICREPGSFDGDGAGSDDSKAHCLPMQKFPVISGALDRVPTCVAEIQDRTQARSVQLVFGDDARFDLDV